MRYAWQAAAIALPRKQLREHSELLSAWFTDFAHWHYANEARMLKLDEDMSTEALELLCEKHKIVASPQLFVEGFSTEMCVWPYLFPSLHGNRTPTNRLVQLRVPEHDYDLMVDEIGWRQVLAAETLFDYVAVTYGRDALPALVEGFRHYDSWIKLIPAVFYITAEEFEQGWQTYLAEINPS